MVVHYKCPNCGADMAFDAKSGHLNCDSCGRTDQIESMAGEKSIPKDATVSYDMDDDDMKAANSGFEQDYEDDDFGDQVKARKPLSSHETKEYNCHNCGAVLLTDPLTAATSCSFCGAGIVISERLSGTYAPDKVIPFAITKEQAEEAFRKWCRKGYLLPNDFKVADRIKTITGLYVPFWLYDMNGRGEIQATATKVYTYTRGDYIYTQRKYYNVFRKADLTFTKIPCDASAKMDDGMMDKLEPFPYDNLKEFQMPYLAGYIAEKYDYDDTQLAPRIKERVAGYVESFLRSTITGYSSVNVHHKQINIMQKNADYALLPVWIVSYDYKKTEHNFIMNGQTGKIVGSPPISTKKALLWFFIISICAFIILQILSLVIGGA